MEVVPTPPQGEGANADLMEETRDLADSINDDAKQATNIIENLKNKIETFETNDETDREGISLLHMKNLQMVDYMTNLVYLMLKKSQGKSIIDDQAIERIVENRTVMEKMRPMEKKLKYQMDKFTRLADNVEAATDDPLHFKPNLASLVGDDDDDEASEEEEEGHGTNDTDAAKDKKYVVPKHVPTLPDDELTRQEIENENQKTMKKKTLSKSIMEDLKRQYMDTPEEEFNHADHMKAKHIAEMRERTRYEEDNYMRLPEMSKKEKHKRRKSMTTVASVGNELTYFGSNNFFNDSSDKSGQKRKRKSVGGKKGSAKKKFKRRM